MRFQLKHCYGASYLQPFQSMIFIDVFEDILFEHIFNISDRSLSEIHTQLQ